MKYKMVALLISLSICNCSFAQIVDLSDSPSQDTKAVFAEFLGGTLSGTIGFFGGLLIGAQIYPSKDDSFIKGIPTEKAISVAYASYVLTVPIGVTMVGSKKQQNGNALAAFGGSLVGAGAVYLVKSNITFFLLPTVGSVLGYNITRKDEQLSIAPTYEKNRKSFAVTFKYMR